MRSFKEQISTHLRRFATACLKLLKPARDLSFLKYLIQQAAVELFARLSRVRLGIPHRSMGKGLHSKLY
jgi:hypothetical protein